MLEIIAIILLSLIVPWAGAAGLIGLFVFNVSFFVVWAVAVVLSIVVPMVLWVVFAAIATLFAVFL